MAIPIGVELEYLNALQDAKDIIDERGNDIVIRTSNEENLERDIYGAIKKRNYTVYNFKVWPILHNPTKDQLEKAGIKEDVDIIVTTAMKDWIDNNLDFNDIDSIRWEVEIDNNKYTIKDKSIVSPFSYSKLNIHLGLFRK